MVAGRETHEPWHRSLLQQIRKLSADEFADFIPNASIVFETQRHRLVSTLRANVASLCRSKKRSPTQKSI